MFMFQAAMDGDGGEEAASISRSRSPAGVNIFAIALWHVSRSDLLTCRQAGDTVPHAVQ
jgi:hypothetical protein